MAVASGPDLIEVCVRLGRPERARAVLSELEGWAATVDSDWAAAARARCRALVATGERAAELFEEALDHHGRSRQLVDTARTRLLYGEFLRRERHRIQARIHLRVALDAFERLGARPWAERAATELRATGETAHRSPELRDELTPQERQIARFVAGGATNKEVAAQLFLSPRTVDYHLRKVFAKLGISARNELRNVDLGG
jgi:DNA-binding CsgD family transcriptional regulator